MIKYKRISLKLSGEALGGAEVIDFEAARRVAKEMKALREAGVEVGVTLGGGNIWRGRRGAAMRMGTVAADQMGMLATLQNCIYMRDALARMGAPVTLMSAVDIPRFAESYNTHRAMEKLSQGNILLLACGTGNPLFSTDSAVVLRAVELECDAILMAKNVDGVYTADPRVDPGAELIRDISYDACAALDLRVMDPGAFILLRDNAFPLVRVFAMEPAENVLRVLDGDPMGTILHP